MAISKVGATPAPSYDFMNEKTLETVGGPIFNQIRANNKKACDAMQDTSNAGMGDDDDGDLTSGGADVDGDI